MARPQLPADAPESEKDKLIIDQAKTIRELEIVVKGYEENLGEPLRKVKEDVEREFQAKLDKEVRLREEKSEWADELVKQLEKERKVRMKLEEERQALAAFVKKFDSLQLGSPSVGSFGTAPTTSQTMLKPPMPTPGGAAAVFAERQRNRTVHELSAMAPVVEADSPMRMSPGLPTEPSLLEEQWDALDEMSFEADRLGKSFPSPIKAASFADEKENLPL